MKKRQLGTLVTPLLSALVLVVSPYALGEPGATQGGTLIYLEQQAHTNLYPPAGGFYPNGGILDQITDRLTWQDPNTLKIEPWLADHWTVNKNETEYTFYLRKGITFSDGTPLDARAVAENFDTYGLGNSKLHLPVSEVVNNYDHSQVINRYTVKFYFKRPSPGFLQGTSTIGSGIVALSTLHKDFEQLGLATNIIGSGPFVVGNEKLGREVDLKARKDYHWGPEDIAQQGRANLDGIQIIVIPEDGVRIGALVSGQADFVRQVQAYVEKRTRAEGFNVIAASTRGVNDSLSFRPDNPLVSDLRVRQALLHATNTEEIVKTLFSPNYPKATSVIARDAAGYVNLSSKLEYNPGLSKKLLAEAGWTPGRHGILEKNGKPLVLTVYVSLPQPQNEQVLQLIAQQWSQVGVGLNIEPGDAGSKAVNNLDPEKTPLFVSEVGRADPDVIKSMFYPLNRDVLLQKGGKSTRVESFRDNTLDQLLVSISTETNPATRLQLTGEVQNYLIDKAYVIPIFEEPQVYAGSPRLHDVSFESVGRPYFYTAWLDKK